MNWVYDDGGRDEDRYHGNANDCVTRAVAIATCRPYHEIYNEINLICTQDKKKRRHVSAKIGIYKDMTRKYLKNLGWSWHPLSYIGSGCVCHLRPDELPSGRIICQLSGHIVAVIDGVIHDTSDPSRSGTRCVYGYWHKESL